MIVVNGTNFIDGLNSLVLGYFFIMVICLQITITNFDLIFNLINLNNLIYFFIILIILNFSNKLFLGDSGAYLLGFLFSYLLIKFYNDNADISPFYVVLLLWYPCFENLFSIIRKFKIKRSPVNPDNYHLQQLIFYFFNKKLKLKKVLINNFSSLMIIFYNLIIFLLANINVYNTKYLIFLILFNILFYVFCYIKLFNYRLNN